MAKIPVKFQKLFGGSLAAPNNIAQFGSLAASAPAYSLDPAVIQGLPAFLNGLAAALINAPGGLASPALQDLNALFYLFTYQLAYLKQAGLAEWDSSVTYYTGSWAQDGAGIPYISVQDNNTNRALTDTNWWVPAKNTLINGAATVKAWVCFNGVTGAIKAQFNVASITKSAVGIYGLNFNTPMADVNYSWNGSCGSGGGLFIPGDDNPLVGGVQGRTSVKTVNQLQVFCFDRPNNALEDSQDICVTVCGN